MSKSLPQTYKVKLIGTSPYLMHNVRLANPLDPFTKTLKQLTGKRNKTDEDHEACAHAEFLGGLYGANDQVYIPGRQLDAAMLVAAKTKKLGKQLQRGVWVLGEELFMEFKGSKDPEQLYVNVDHRDIRPVNISGRKIMRCRPIFREWSTVAEILIDEQMMNLRDVEDILKIAGQMVGLGELRPRYGRFDVQVIR